MIGLSTYFNQAVLPIDVTVVIRYIAVADPGFS